MSYLVLTMEKLFVNFQQVIFTVFEYYEQLFNICIVMFKKICEILLQKNTDSADGIR